MLPGGVVCFNDSSSAMGVAVRKSGVDRCILMIEGSRDRTTSVVVLGKRSSGRDRGAIRHANKRLLSWM